MTDLFRTILNMSITGVYIAAAIIILRLFMKKLPKKYSYLLWAILGIRLLCPFSFSSAVSVFNVLVPEKPEISSGQMEYIPQDIEYSYEPKITVSVPQVNNTVNNYLPPAEPNNSVNPMQIVMSICTIVWLVGMATMVIYTVLSYISVRRRVKSAKEQNGIFICDNIESPFVFGIIKPRIYLPENVSEEDMRFIIAHEQAHIRRGDHIVKLIAMAALCIHWFNPIVWISYRLMTKDMELSCDEKALGTFDDDVKKAYANALLNISMRQNKLTLGGVLSFGESDIKSRIKGVLGAKKPKVIVTIIAVIAVIIAAVCLLTNAEKDDFKGKSYTFVSPATDLETALNFENVVGDDPLCMNIKIPYDAKQEANYVRFSHSTVMKISPFVKSPVDMDTVDAALMSRINNAGMGHSCTMTEHITEENTICHEYSSTDDPKTRLICFIADYKPNDYYNIILFVTTDDEFTYERAEKIVSTAQFMLYYDFSDEPAETDTEIFTETQSAESNETLTENDESAFQTVSLKQRPIIPDEYGGYNFDQNAELIDVKFAVPAEWTADGHGLFMLGEEKVLEQNVVYSDSYGLLTEGFTIDMVSGREIKKIDEKYGDENDPYRYYIHTSMQSYDGVYDTHYFVIQQNGYYATFCFNDSEDFNMAIAEAVLSTVTVSPVYLDINLDSMQAASTIIDIGTLQSDGTIKTTGEDGAAEVYFFIPSEWFTSNTPGMYYNKNMFRVESVYKAVPDRKYPSLNGTNGTIPLFASEVNVMGESYAAEGGNSPYDYMVHKTVNSSECYEYVVTRGDHSAVVHFNADPSSTEVVRNAIIRSIKIEKVTLSDVKPEGIDFSASYDSPSMIVTMSIANNSDREFVAFDEGIEIYENGKYVPVSFFSLYAEEKTSMHIWDGEGLEYSQTMGAMAYPDFKVGKYRAVITGYFSDAPDVRSMMYAEFEIE